MKACRACSGPWDENIINQKNKIMKKKIVMAVLFSMAILCTVITSNNMRSYVNTLDLLSGNIEALSDNNPDPHHCMYDVPGKLPKPKECTIVKVVNLDTGVEAGSYIDTDTSKLRAQYGYSYSMVSVQGLYNICNGGKADDPEYGCHPYSCRVMD